MEQIPGTGGASPEDKKVYQKEFIKGAALFQEALEKHHEAKEAPQKAAFEKVMKEALEVMNQTAKQGFDKEKVAKEQKLEKDYKSYLSDQDEKNYQELLKTIGSLKK